MSKKRNKNINTDDNYFAKNVAALKEKYYEVYRRLNEPLPFDVEIRGAHTGVMNLYVNKDSEDFYPCYNENDPLNDLPEMIEKLKDAKGSAICMMGAGLCIQVSALLEIVGDSNLIILYEAFPGIFKKSMESVDLEKVISHPNVRLIVGENPDLYNLFSGDREKLLSLNGTIIVGQGRITELAPEWYGRNRKSLEQFFNKKNKNIEVGRGAGEVLFKNRFENLITMADSTPFDKLKDRYKGIPAVIVAAGPSLAKNIELLKNQKRAIVVAVDSAVAPLMKHGIIPDFVATADFRDFTYEKLSPFSDKLGNCELIFAAEGSPVIPRYIDFKEKYYLFQNTPCRFLFSEILGKKIPSLSDAQSVVHYAIHATQLMGCEPIIFTGLDLAYEENKDHVEGTILHWGNQINTQDSKFLVEGIDGNKVASNPGFIAMKEICEHMIKEGADVKYIDATEGGAKIDGTAVKTLNETLKTYCPENVNRISTDTIDSTSDTAFILKGLKKQQKEVAILEKKLSVYFNCQNITDSFFKKNKNISSVESIPEKIKKHIRKMDSITTYFNDNKHVSYLKDLLVKSQSDYLDHEIGVFTNDGLTEQMQQLFSSLGQQKFVQKIRFDALNILKSQIDEQTALFSEGFKLENAVENNPESLADKLRLVQFYYNCEFLNKAESLLKTIPEHPEAIFYLACIKINQGFVNEGKKDVEILCLKNTEYQKKYDDFCLDIIEKWMQSEGPQTYKKIMVDRALLLDPDNKDALRIKKAFINSELLQNSKSRLIEAKKLYDTGDADGMADLYEQVGNTEIHNKVKAEWFQLKARFLLETGNQDDGLACLDEAVKLDSQMAVLWEEIGDNLLQSNDYNSALIAYEKCLTALPDRVEVLIKIGDIYYTGGQKQVAAVAYEGVLSKYPDHKHATERLAQIRKELI